MADINVGAALRIWALAKRREAAAEAPAAAQGTPLSVSAAAAFWHEQRINLISRIYSTPSNGTLPIPGGKFELGKRGRQFGGD